MIPGTRGLHATVLRLPRPFRRPEAAWGRSSLRPLDPGHGLSARSGRAPASPISAALGRAPDPDPRPRPAHLRDERDGAPEATHDADPGRRHRARILSRVSARPE